MTSMCLALFYVTYISYLMYSSTTLYGRFIVMYFLQIKKWRQRDEQ